MLLSQHHRITEVGRDFCRTSSPTPLFQQGHQEPAAGPCLSRQHLNISKSEHSTTSLGSCQCLVILTVKAHFLMFRRNRLRPLLLVLSRGTTEKRLALPAMHTPFRYLYTLIRNPQAFSSPDRTVPALSAFPPRDAPVPPSTFWAFIRLTPVTPCLSSTGGLRFISPVPGRGEGSPPLPCYTALPNTTRPLLAASSTTIYSRLKDFPIFKLMLQLKCG